MTNVDLKKTVVLAVSMLQIENYLKLKHWKKASCGGWSFKDGNEMIQDCFSEQMILNQLSFIENRPSFEVWQEMTQSESKLNPYAMLEEYEPFALFGLTLMIGEAFKKITCAGISGREKPAEQDIKEAIYSLTRAIEESERGAIFDIESLIDCNIERIIKRYVETFGDSQRLKAARYVLLFCETNRTTYLLDAIETLK